MWDRHDEPAVLCCGGDKGSSLCLPFDSRRSIHSLGVVASSSFKVVVHLRLVRCKIRSRNSFDRFGADAAECLAMGLKAHSSLTSVNLR